MVVVGVVDLFYLLASLYCLYSFVISSKVACTAQQLAATAAKAATTANSFCCRREMSLRFCHFCCYAFVHLPTLCYQCMQLPLDGLVIVVAAWLFGWWQIIWLNALLRLKLQLDFLVCDARSLVIIKCARVVVVVFLALKMF